MGVPPPLLNFFPDRDRLEEPIICGVFAKLLLVLVFCFPESVVLSIFLFATTDAISLSQQPTKLPKRGAIATWALRPPSWLSGALSHALYVDAFPPRAYFLQSAEADYCAACHD